MQIESNHYVLAVHDLAVSSDFYQRALGFRETHNDGDWCFLQRDDVTLMLGRCDDAMPASELGDHSYFAYLQVDDVDAFHRRLVAEGAELTSALADKPWGMREVGVRTPDGHRIMIGQSLSPRA